MSVCSCVVRFSCPRTNPHSAHAPVVEATLDSRPLHETDIDDFIEPVEGNEVYGMDDRDYNRRSSESSEEYLIDEQKGSSAASTCGLDDN